MLWAAAAPAAAVPDGYACSAEAFTNIGGLDGVGAGEVILRADAQYRATGGQFTYRVRQRDAFGALGYSRIQATWNLAGGRAEGLSKGQAIWLPLRRGVVSTPASIDISLDEGPPISIPILDSWLDRDAFGSALALRIPPAAAPELRGRRSFGYELMTKNGRMLSSDLLLMPEWKKLRLHIRSGLGRAGSQLRQKKCDSLYSITTSGG
jgi:hypothetical protein